MRILAALTLAIAVACSIPTQESAPRPLPDRASFVDTGVSAFIERRCGSLDCHGQPGRPLRVYSEWGLRLEANEDGSRDKRPTTATERLENYRAAVGLEPENLSRCFETRGEEYATLQLILKPLDVDNGGVRHKGGPVLRPTPSDPGWQCLFGWVSGDVHTGDCERAARLE